MKKPRFLTMVTLFLLLAGTSSWAAGAYITDSFEVTVRTGPSNQNKIVSMPSSGQAVKVIETQGDWSLVRLATKDGENQEGWILNRYLITRMPWELQAAAAKEQNGVLKERLARAEQERNEFKSRETDLSGKLQSATAALEKLQGEFDALQKGAAGYTTLKKDYDEAVSALEKNRNTLEALSRENRELKSSQQDKWILTGAAILLCGLFIGLVVGRMQRRRRSLY
ncbi:MAG: TIGR04211 family SH3 domain-containing protein [Desulfobacteraceae bacterium]|nr:MAG: TIGR04211 family SH3 domain-containing protein [Desulfobacteraceae bacterium]